MSPTLTAEQLAIVEHDLDKHATVLAVAGSGKTSTMVQRIGYLLEQGVPNVAIRAIMYNRSAREDFERKLAAEGLSCVKVQTFHSLGYSLLTWASQNGFCAGSRLTDDPRPLAYEAIKSLRQAGEIAADQVIDVDDALDAISTWKAILTPPAEAQHLLQPAFELIYREFEVLRNREQLITFDDQIYEAVRLLEQNQQLQDRMTNRLEHLIIDEFQDVNLARLRLAKIIAGQTARVMVVGDDDQCIYEWQGARSLYIKRGFKSEFTHFPHSTYKLTRSFRFGPTIAQVAANVIGHNTDRVDKELVADDLRQGSLLDVHFDPGGGGDEQIAAVLQELLANGVAPTDIVILVRKYSQSFAAQSLMIANHIPFFVDGQAELRSAFAVRLALDYLDLVVRLDLPLTQETGRCLVDVINRPYRFIKRDTFERLARQAVSDGQTLSDLLTDQYACRDAGLPSKAANELIALERTLQEAGHPSGSSQSAPQPTCYAGDAVRVLLSDIDFHSAFARFASDAKVDEHLAMIEALAQLFDAARVPLPEARTYIESLDTRLGRPDDKCLRVTSIFKAKGLEWDHVLLPGLVEGQIPDLRAIVNLCVNRAHPNLTVSPTETIESERRLFYVALTRARRAVYLFADPAANQESRFLHEAVLQQTKDAVDALQALLTGRPATPELTDSMEAAGNADVRLREGLLNMLRRCAERATPQSALHQAITKATYCVNSTGPAPFSYPHAYPKGPVVRSLSRDSKGLGLPF